MTSIHPDIPSASPHPLQHQMLTTQGWAPIRPNAEESPSGHSKGSQLPRPPQATPWVSCCHRDAFTGLVPGVSGLPLTVASA